MSALRRMEPGDVATVAKVHLASFPGFFLSFLGPRFLFLFYSRICAAPEGIAFVFNGCDGRPAGFVAGTSNPRGFYKRLLRKDWLSFSLASLGAIYRRPSQQSND